MRTTIFKFLRIDVSNHYNLYLFPFSWKESLNLRSKRGYSVGAIFTSGHCLGNVYVELNVNTPNGHNTPPPLLLPTHTHTCSEKQYVTVKSSEMKKVEERKPQVGKKEGQR